MVVKTRLTLHPWLEVEEIFITQMFPRGNGSYGFMKTVLQVGDGFFISRDTPASITMWRGPREEKLFFGGIARSIPHLNTARFGSAFKSTFPFWGLQYLGFDWPKKRPNGILSTQALAEFILQNIFPDLAITFAKVPVPGSKTAEQKEWLENVMGERGVYKITEIKPRTAP